MPGATYWSIRRAQSYGLEGVDGLAGPPDAVGSYFKAQTDQAEAKARVEEMRIKETERRKRKLGLARIEATSSSLWKRWTPVLVVGGVLVLGAFALAIGTRKKPKEAR